MRANIAQSEYNFGDFLFSVGGNSRTTKSICKMAGRLGCDAAYDFFKRDYKEISTVNVHLVYDSVVQTIGTDDIVMSMKTPYGMK